MNVSHIRETKSKTIAQNSLFDKRTFSTEKLNGTLIKNWAYSLAPKPIINWGFKTYNFTNINN